MRVQVAIPEASVDKPILDAALESVTRLNESLMKDGKLPPFSEAIARGVQWKPEPYESEHFDHGVTVLKRGWGDCDDLAPYRAADLRHSGEDPEATAIVRRSGPKRWHAIVQRGDGSIDDPSRTAGMGRSNGIVGASLPVMYTAPSAIVGGEYNVRPALALREYRGYHQARADLPLQHSPDYALATLHTAPNATSALVGAIQGACRLGLVSGTADPDHIDRLNAIAAALDGEDIDHIAAIYGDDHAAAAAEVVGTFFGKAGKLLKKVVKNPITSAALSFVPGVGPLAAGALKLASGVKLPGKKGGKAAPGGAPGAASQPATAEQPLASQPMNPFPSVAQYAREGRLCIPCTWE